MEMQILPSGNLKIALQRGDKELVKSLLERHQGDDIGFMADLVEQTGWQGNNMLHTVRPEDIGALTCAPIVADDVDIDDNGTVNVPGNVWWYPNYAVRHFADDFLSQGYTIFQKAH